MTGSKQKSFGLACALLAFFQCFQARAAREFNASAYETAIREEMQEWGITGIAVAIIDDQQTIYGRRFGQAEPNGVFRCGSISKLFTAVAVMQLVEQGKLDLDAPLDRYVPEAVPVNPFSTNGPMTLRQVLCHRSGIVRESPVGGYFDGAEPGFEKMVASVRQTVLATPPNAKLRYSNVGPSLAGYIVSKLANSSYPDYQRDHILKPLEMEDSAWLLRDLRQRVVPSGMRIAGREGGFKNSRAPVFDLGTLPAGNLFTTAEDLARFISMLAGGGKSKKGETILRPETLEQMFTPQLISESSGFGIGFSIGTFQGRKTVGHSGAVYGFSSSLVFLPKEKVGIVVLGNQDIVNGRIQKLANLGLSLLLQARFGEKLPAQPETISLSSDQLAEFAGAYESASYWAELSVVNGILSANISSQPTRLRAVEPLKFLADSALYDSASVVFERASTGKISSFRLGGQTYKRVPPQRPAIPEEWRKLLGSYGPKFIPLVVHERFGHLYATTENMVDYRLAPLNQYVFEMPPGMYVNEHLVFAPVINGRPPAVSLAGMVLKRR